MGRLTPYRQIIVKTLNKYADLWNRSSSALQEATVVSDPGNDHYLLTLLGWRGNQRIKGNDVKPVSYRCTNNRLINASNGPRCSKPLSL